MFVGKLYTARCSHIGRYADQRVVTNGTDGASFFGSPSTRRFVKKSDNRGYQMIRKCLLLVLALASAQATAGYIVTLEEVGSDVVATGSGPIDLTGLTQSFSSIGGASLTPNLGFIQTGPNLATNIQIYSGITGPSAFGSGGSRVGSSGSGDLVGVRGNANVLFVPLGYVSGSPLSDTVTYLNQDFTSLGVTSGTYVWSWGTGVNQNFTLVIEEEATPTPAPATLALLGLGLAGLGWSRRRK